MVSVKTIDGKYEVIDGDIANVGIEDGHLWLHDSNEDVVAIYPHGHWLCMIAGDVLGAEEEEAE